MSLLSDKILDQIANKHLPYEIDQLRGTFIQLMQMESGASDESDIARRIVKNALIESFCVHARSLIDFFANRCTNPDDVVAKNSGSFSASLEPEREPLHSIRIKLNKQIFHLTRNRTLIETEQFDASTAGVEVLRLIEPEIARFNALRQLNCTIPPIQTPHLQSQTTTTSLTRPMQTIQFNR